MISRRRLTTEWLPLAAIVAVAAIAAIAFALQLVQYVVMPDELTYSKQGLEFAHGNLVTPSDFWFNSWALLRPLLMAPFFRWMDVTGAFDAVRITGGLIMATAAVPAYLLTRRASSHRVAALLVAALTVAIPWLLMSGTFMLEPIAYPAFLWAVFAMVHAVARPSWKADLLVVVAIGVAFVSRTQLGALAPAFVAAVALDALLRRDGAPSAGRRLLVALNAHRVLVGAAVAATLVVAVTGSATRLLGNYSTPTEGALVPSGTGRAAHELLAYVVVGVGGLPLAGAAAWVATTLGRRLPRDAHAVASVIVVVVLVMTFIAGSFSVRFTEGINDRYLFYIAPLLFTGLAAGLAEGGRRFVPALAIAGLLSVWLVWTAALAQPGPSLVSPSTVFHGWLGDRAADLGGSLTAPRLAAIAFAVGVAGTCIAALRAGKESTATAVCALLLVFCIAETAYTFDKVAATQNDASAAFLAQRGWMDRAVPYGAKGAVVLSRFGDDANTAATWWDASFWNYVVRATFRLAGTNEFEQGITNEFAIDPKTGRIPALDPYAYVIRGGNDTRFGLRGSTTVAAAGGVVLLKADRPYQANWLFEGKDLDTATVTRGSPGVVTAFGDPGTARIMVTLSAPAGGTHFTVASGTARRSGVVRGGRRVTVDVPARFESPGFAKLRISTRGGPLFLLDVARA